MNLWSLCVRAWGAFAYMKITTKIYVIFPQNDRFRAMKVATAGLNHLLLAAGGDLKVNFPLKIHNKLEKIAEFLEALSAEFVFFT